MKTLQYLMIPGLSAVVAQADTITDSLASDSLNPALWTVSETMQRQQETISGQSAS